MYFVPSFLLELVPHAMALTVEPNPVMLPGSCAGNSCEKFKICNNSNHPVLFKLKQIVPDQIQCTPSREIINPNSSITIELKYIAITGSNQMQIPVRLEYLELDGIQPCMAEDLFSKYPGKSVKNTFYVTFRELEELNFVSEVMY